MRVTLSALALFVVCGIASTPLAAEAKGRAASSGNITYKPAPEATLKYRDGVTVHRHSDGSVEVSDPETVTPLYPSRRPVRKAVRGAVAVHKVVKNHK